MVKELLTSVDQQVHTGLMYNRGRKVADFDLGRVCQMEDLEKIQRLKEILAKLDPRAETRVREGGLFKSAELLRRKLVHEGNLLWKTPGSRHKGTGHWKVTMIQYKYWFDSYSGSPYSHMY